MYDQFYKVLNSFKKNKVEDPLYETLRFFDIILNKSISKADLSGYLKNDEELDSLATHRSQGQPMEYLLGIGSFYGNIYFCAPGALIPRDETELLVKTALSYISGQDKAETIHVVDMGTGCGSIAISIALNDGRTRLIASDLNEGTTLVAKKNITKFQLEDRVTLLTGDLYAPFNGLGLEEQIDIVVCNPPYIPSTSLSKMESEIIDHEPKEAFDGGAFGIEFYKRLIYDSLLFLKKDGVLVFEIGQGQEKLVNRLFKKNETYHNIKFHDDGENVRVISVVKK